MESKLKKIGVTGYYVSSEQNKDGWIKGVPGQQFSMFSYDFVESILSSKALPILMPIVPKKYIKEQLSVIDALILAGGEDVHPKYYTRNSKIEENDDISLERDEYEFELLQQALEMNIPILLVCRGMQLLNVLQKGTLYEDINTELDTEIEHLIVQDRAQGVHEVKLSKEHFVTSLIGEAIEVNTIHHQAIKGLGEGLEIVGKAQDGIIEIVSMKDRDDIIAVQWHPEMMYGESAHAKDLFDWLVDSTK